MSICPHCGNENRSESKFCSKCGRPLAIQAAPKAIPANANLPNPGKRIGPNGKPQQRYPGLTIKVIASIIVAIIGATGLVIAALVTGTSNETRGKQEAEAKLLPTIAFLEAPLTEVNAQKPAVSVSSMPDITSTLNVSITLGTVQGTLTDRSGAPISNMSVAIRNGPKTVTDSLGNFVLENVSIGQQTIIVEPPSGPGQYTQNVYIEKQLTTYMNLVIDAETNQIGLLSISVPINFSTLEIQAGVPHRDVIHGRCDGLAQIFGGYDKFKIWILVRAIKEDSNLWVQSPSAIVDRNNNTWQASIQMGSQDSPPYDGQQWVLVAVATNADAVMEIVTNVPSVESLPFPILTSNVVNVTLKVK